MARMSVFIAAALLALVATAPAAATPTGTPTAAVVGATPVDLAQPGPFAVTSTATIIPCAGPGAAAQNADARRQGARTALQCTTTVPIEGGPRTSVDYWFPTESAGPRPLIVFVPGDGANPGYFAALARHWASYGFVVAVAAIRGEILPGSPVFGVDAAVAANRDPRSPVYGRMDTHSVILAGHSAGATKSIEVAGLDTAARRGLPIPADLRLPAGTHVRAVLAIQPDVYTVTAAVETPTYTVTGDADRTSRAGPIEAIVQDRITGPAWYAVARGAPHLVAVDPVDTIPFTRSAVAFLMATTGDTHACAVFVGRDWTLHTDPTYVRTVRNRAATSATCPIGAMP